MRRIVASLLPLLVAAPLMGQTTLGIRGGLSRATVFTGAEEMPDQDGLRGVVAGVDIAFPLAGTVELRIGGAYSRKGTSYSASADLASGGFEDIGGSGSIEADYVQLSALARIGTPRNGGMSVGLLVGPWAASLLSCDASLNFDLGELGSVSAPCDDEMKSTDFGLAVGAGVEMTVSDGLRLGVDLIYSLGLANVDDPSTEDFKTRHLAVQAGIVIPLGG